MWIPLGYLPGAVKGYKRVLKKVKENPLRVNLWKQGFEFKTPKKEMRISLKNNLPSLGRRMGMLRMKNAKAQMNE
eukprot:12236805-Karenia_brevis.AAC.1